MMYASAVDRLTCGLSLVRKLHQSRRKSSDAEDWRAADQQMGYADRIGPSSNLTWCSVCF
jgi:hypothetical protein